MLQYHPSYGVHIVNNNIVAPYEWSPDITTMNEFAAADPEYGDLESYYIHWGDGIDSDHRVQHYWAGNLEYHLPEFPSGRSVESDIPHFQNIVEILLYLVP